MKKTVLFFMLFATLFGSFSLPAQAQAVRHQWYCKHVKDHVQPPLDERLSFIEEHNAYYIDRRHANADDGDKVIYLTFDAGYENGNIVKTLDILRDENVPAAFFILDTMLYKSEELVRRMINEGHTVANHTATHPDMSRIASKDAFAEELQALERQYKDLIGSDMPKLYRPPQGKFSEENLRQAHEMGYHTFFWSLAYVDWYVDKQPSREEALNKLTSRIHPGAIVLLHSTSSTNAAVLDELLTRWKAMGYTIAPLQQLIT